MRALRFHGNQDIRVEDIEEPKLQPGHVKVRIAYCGICGSDLHEWRVGPVNAPTKPHPHTGDKIPTVLGHEPAGTIVEVDSSVNSLKVGDKVAVFPCFSCLKPDCHWCQTEVYGLCPEYGFYGYACSLSGGMAEYGVFDHRKCFKIPDHIGLDVAALVEPLAVGWHAVKKGEVNANSICLVIGAGPIGISVVHGLVAAGVKQIIVSEPTASRAEQAKIAGATKVLDPRQTDVVAHLRGLEDGHGAHTAFECAGIQVSFDTALKAVRGGGTIVNVAVYEKSELVWHNPNELNRMQLRVVGSNIYTPAEYQEVIDAIADGQIRNPETMITGKVSLDRVIEDGFDQLLKGVEGHVKILVSPNTG